MYQAVICSFKISQNFISYESAEDWNLWAIFNRVKNALSCNIFTKQYFNWDALLNCQRWTCFLQPLFPRDSKMVKFKGLILDRRLYDVGQHFTFWRFSLKRKSFGNFDCDFRKCFSKGIFLTENEVFRNFSFEGKFTIFYRQLLLNIIYFQGSDEVQQQSLRRCLGTVRYLSHNSKRFGNFVPHNRPRKLANLLGNH